MYFNRESLYIPRSKMVVAFKCKEAKHLIKGEFSRGAKQQQQQQQHNKQCTFLNKQPSSV